MATVDLPEGISITYRQQYRRCGKPGCRVCGPGAPGHGPYWYASWWEGGQVRSRYLGKQEPPAAAGARTQVSRGAAPAPPAPARPATLRVRTLGRFAVWRGATPVPPSAWSKRKVTSLFKCLITSPGQRLHREQAIEMLWPDTGPEHGASNLRYTVHLLRRVLEGPGGKQGYVQLQREHLILRPGGGVEPPADWLDALAFEQAATAALEGKEIGACRAALGLYGGEYLPEDVYDEWATGRRETLRRQRLALLLHLASLCAARGEATEAERALRAVLALDACHEEAARALMLLLGRAGRRGEAVRVYQDLTAALQADLEVEPSPETTQLHARLVTQQGRPGTAPPAARPQTAAGEIPGVDGPLQAPAGPPSNLPAPVTSFVGRAEEVREVARLLRSARLLTLTGPGGCGKTRLALEVAGATLQQYPDGAWLVELAALSDPLLVPRTVALALKVREEPDRPLLDTLTAHLKPRTLLLVLDNCEHMIGACAALAAVLLRGCPRVRILSTSREALGIGGETIWRVPPLALPPGARPSALAGLSPARLANYAAVQLFLERARAVRPDFELTERNAALVAQLCIQLDGIPLAIELAAARVHTLQMEGLTDRLDDRFRLLIGGPRTALPRHQTLRAALDWSHDLLSAEERLLLRRLAVFAGGWTLEAAEAVCADAPLPPRHTSPGIRADEVLDLLGALVNKSLVVLEERDGEGRYRLLETVRQYGRDRLVAAGELLATRERHLAWYLALAGQAEQALLGPQQTAWLAKLDREHDNVRAVLTWCTQEEGRPEAGLQLAGSLWRFWWIHGHLGEGRLWLEAALTRAVGAPAAIRARALNGAGVLAFFQGDYARARALHEESLALRRLLRDARGIAGSLNNLGLVALDQGDYERARVLQEESLVLQRELGDRRGIANSLNNLGIVAVDQGDCARAAALHKESLALFRGLGDNAGVALQLGNLALVANVQGDYARAKALHEGSLVLQQELGDHQGIANRLEGLAMVAGAQGQPEQAARLFGAAEALREAIGAPLPQRDRGIRERAVASVRGALSAAAFTTAWAAGRALSLKAAVTTALGTQSGEAPRPSAATS